MAGVVALPLHAAEQSGDWTRVTVPSSWEEQGVDALSDFNGWAWYRCYVQVPQRWTEDRTTLWTRSVTLHLDHVANAHEAYINGVKIGSAGGFPPNYSDASSTANRHSVPVGLLKSGQFNTIAIRVYNESGPGGIYEKAPILAGYYKEIVLEGEWEIRRGDDTSWAIGAQKSEPAAAVFTEARDATSPLSPPSHFIHGERLSPQASKREMEVAGGLTLQQVLTEPRVAQPISMHFDAQGRLWVVQYRQYPFPAGLEMVSRDKYYRAVYEEIPPPPPYAEDSAYRGKDRITVHEDLDADGRFERHKTFLDGLNITTDCLPGPKGVWVLTPPYLLFYPDQDGDGIPDSKPEVHLKGFGLEDTHSVANSLRWGPDGWIYGAQGSTVSAQIEVVGRDTEAIHSMGQLVWRYHPDKQRYEIFAEGGGNTFGLEFDSKGRLFSGHNGGGTRGFHYVQGGYYKKGIAKHGPLSNPFTYGQLDSMAHPQAERFSHAILRYEGGSLPAKYHGKLLAAEPLHGRITLSAMEPDGSSFETRDLSRPVRSNDRSFRPVALTLGPSGAVYVADFYEDYIAHGQHYQGYLDPTSGRIYRIQDRDASAPRPFDLTQKSTPQLLRLLGHSNRWLRKTVRFLLAERPPHSTVPHLVRNLDRGSGQEALESLWTLNLIGGFDETLAQTTLFHTSPHVRRWSIRLLGDDRQVSPEMADQLADKARTEPNAAVRSQLACTARRLSPGHALPILRNLLHRQEDLNDPQIPLLLWWGLETLCGESTEMVVKLFETESFWGQPLVQQEILSRLMRRLAEGDTQNGLIACARLLELAPTAKAEETLINGFEAAFEGRTLPHLPDRLTSALASTEGSSLTLDIRRGESDAIEEVFNLILAEETDSSEKLEYIEALDDTHAPQSVEPLLKLLSRDEPVPVLKAALGALQQYQDPTIAETVISHFDTLSSEVKIAALNLLTTRQTWTLRLLEAIEAGRVAKADITSEIRNQIGWQKSPKISALHEQIFGSQDASEAAGQPVQDLIATVQSGQGNPYRGRKIFMARCASCHKLFDEGGDIGPDLTRYPRNNLERLLRNIVQPNAEIREGYRTFIAETKDGRQVVGFRADQSPHVVTLKTISGQETTIEKSNLKNLQPRSESLMPQGLLNALSAQQIRDLIAYLRSGQPLNP